MRELHRRLASGEEEVSPAVTACVVACWCLAQTGTMLSTALQNLVAAFPVLRRAVAESGVVAAPVMRARVMLGAHYETVTAALPSSPLSTALVGGAGRRVP